MKSPSRFYSLVSCFLFAMVVGLSGSRVVAAPPPGIPDGWSDAFVYANGIRIHYYHATPAPGKPVMVMIHGVTDIGLSWTTLTWKLQNDYDIYMVDTRGHGLSDPFTASDDGDTLVKDVVEFVRAMKFEKPILMGHSMGGATVIRVGAEYPDLAKAIIVLDAGVGRRGPRPADAGARSGAANPPPPPRPSASSSDPLAFRMNGAPEDLVKQNNYSFDDLVAKARRENPRWDLVDCQYWVLSKKQYHGPYSEQAWQSMSGSMRTADALAKVAVPLIILKADAPAAAREEHLEAAKVIQKGRLVHIENSGHNLHHDQPDRTTELVKEFLSANSE